MPKKTDPPKPIDPLEAAKQFSDTVTQVTDPKQPDESAPQALARQDNQAAFQAMVRRDDAMVAAFQGLVPASLGEAFQLATYLARSNAVPSGLKGNPETVLTVILAGIELGLTPIRAIQSITNIKGNLAMRADLQLALVRRSGTLEVFNEGFEFRGKTDRNLAIRCETADLILALVEDVPEGKPYGWCTIKRRGDQQNQTRVFTWNDAERFVINERDDDGMNASGQARTQATPKKLSEKSNYRNSPQDMYPKRARVRVLQVTHGDILAGLPAVEALEGVIDVDVEDTPRPTSTEDQIAIELGAMRIVDGDSTGKIALGFAQLDMAPAKRLQLMKRFQGRPVDLVDHLRTEWANRTSAGGRKKPTVLDATVEGDEPKGPSVQEPDTEQATGPKPIESAARKLADIAKEYKGLDGMTF